ncbi:unnamed protein product [Phytophthora fragariaefolia]|uniref:Unnamed protein product n=1 Tax=Phytophthora fragariaefolia TaxID=1490495 RepID=A0A9W6XKC0_9STRA|nr:unnamed protein product [Phytophthora fragariaefolia]
MSVLALFLLTANIALTERATSIALVRAEEHLASLRESASIKGNTSRGSAGNLIELSSENIVAMETEFIYTIHHVAQRMSEPRGIVLPLFDGIAALGMSLIMELRNMSVDLPIEVPHCGDLNDSLQRTVLEKEDMGTIRFYDVCELAAQTVSTLDESRKVFCQSITTCHRSYRSFDIKLLAVTFSQFEELMLLDADTLFFESPMSLWDTDKYRSTGTLFFHDRISQANMYLGHPFSDNNNVSDLNRYISSFDVSLFAPLGKIDRPNATSENEIPVELSNYSPSEHLLTSHSWNHRAGHEMDSSLVLWSKKRQPRATAILASFTARGTIKRPPSYGDKELFFIAAELAETQYAFSDFGVGGVGWDIRDNGPNKSVVCGHASHYYPEKPADLSTAANTSVLYLNSDSILSYDPNNEPVYYSQARLYEVYAGSFGERGWPQECPFDVTVVRFSAEQEERMLQRQRFHEIVASWIEEQ